MSEGRGGIFSAVSPVRDTLGEGAAGITVNRHRAASASSDHPHIAQAAISASYLVVFMLHSFNVSDG